jgi:DNA-binding GntR family transcriptional regulator
MTMPDPRAYRRLAALLRDQITSGMIAPGVQLPAIGELRRQHGHSRQTVTKAMGVLQEEGLICRWPGLGYFAADKDEVTARG